MREILAGKTGESKRASSSRLRRDGTDDGSAASRTWLSIVTDQQMLKERISPSVCFAAQLSVFLKGNVSFSADPFSFS
jgi:hypothetical protein